VPGSEYIPAAVLEKKNQQDAQGALSRSPEKHVGHVICTKLYADYMDNSC